MISRFNDYLYNSVTVFKVNESINVLEIYKNASTSLRRCNFKVYQLSELADLYSIDIFIREPYRRYLSAVRSLIKSGKFDGDQIDTYLFLDKHTNLQFNYVINLLNYTDAKLSIRPISELSDIIPYRNNVSVTKIINSLDKRFMNNEQLHYFLQFDNILYKNLMNKTITQNDIIDVLETHYNDLYNEQILKYHNILQRCNNIS